METFSLILSFIFGTIVGSFLNVVSLRMKTGMTLGGRSKCMSCGKELGWAELVPLFSFVFQGGSCRKCKSKISWQYPLVEFFLGVIFVLIIIKFPPLTLSSAFVTAVHLVAACLLTVIVVYDIKHKIIPDSFVFAFGALGLGSVFLYAYPHMPSLESLLAGPILALPFALIWLVSRGKWMGLGDAKLTLGIGWFLGINAGINALILAFWIGAVVSLIWLFMTYGRFKARTEIPFGPYLILGMYLVLLAGIQVVDIGLLRDILTLV